MLKKPVWSRLSWERQGKHAGPHEVGLVLQEEVGGMLLRRSLRKELCTELPGAAGCWQKQHDCMPVPARHLCRAHGSTEQGRGCTFTGENIHVNVFIDPWYPVGLRGVRYTGATHVNYGWTSDPGKCCPEQRLPSCNKHRGGKSSNF